jgi:hypothetical protein
MDILVDDCSWYRQSGGVLCYELFGRCKNRKKGKDFLVEVYKKGS